MFLVIPRNFQPLSLIVFLGHFHVKWKAVSTSFASAKHSEGLYRWPIHLHIQQGVLVLDVSCLLGSAKTGNLSQQTNANMTVIFGLICHQKDTVMVVTCVSVVTTQALRVQLRGADGATGETGSHFFLRGTLALPPDPPSHSAVNLFAHIHPNSA